MIGSVWWKSYLSLLDAPTPVAPTVHLAGTVLPTPNFVNMNSRLGLAARIARMSYGSAAFLIQDATCRTVAMLDEQSTRKLNAQLVELKAAAQEEPFDPVAKFAANILDNWTAP